MYDLDKINGPGAAAELEAHRKEMTEHDLAAAQQELADAEKLGDALAITRAKNRIAEAREKLGIETTEAGPEQIAA